MPEFPKPRGVHLKGYSVQEYAASQTQVNKNVTSAIKTTLLLVLQFRFPPQTLYSNVKEN
jgi:hypothetical protein